MLSALPAFPCASVSLRPCVMAFIFTFLCVFAFSHCQRILPSFPPRKWKVSQSGGHPACSRRFCVISAALLVFSACHSHPRGDNPGASRVTPRRQFCHLCQLCHLNVHRNILNFLAFDFTFQLSTFNFRLSSPHPTLGNNPHHRQQNRAPAAYH
jgi:hypothetical protein